MSVRETYRILDCVDLTELAALTDNQKELFKLIISAKVVTLDEGSPMYNVLFGMFPEGTTTGDALRDPVNGLVPLPLTPNPE